jgi:hypothetical protein
MRGFMPVPMEKAAELSNPVAALPLCAFAPVNWLLGFDPQL